jgi:metallo-beta-lactamase family protein
MFQGLDVQYLNWEDFKFDPAALDFVILTHAHIDHSGLLPKLTKKGFRGKIYLTAQTAAITSLLLLDSAKVQDLNYNARGGSNALLREKGVIYNSDDVVETINLFQTVNFLEPTKANDEVEFEYLPVGHILGAASVSLEVDGKKFLFSGDIGRTEQSLIKSFPDYDFSKFSPDYIVMESLYGGVVHPTKAESIKSLLDAINQTLTGNGNVIIPVFALHRTQEILEILKFALLAEHIKNNVQIYLDSPLANEITKIYTANTPVMQTDFSLDDIKYVYKENLEGPEGENRVFDSKRRFNFEELRFIKKWNKSLGISGKSNSIILAGSGMADGGRVVHHLFSTLNNPKTSVIFIGFQAPGTLGRQLVEGATQVTINGKSINVKAKIIYLKGFSAHADNNDLFSWMAKFDQTNLKKVFLMHAELDRSEAFANNLAAKQFKPQVSIPNIFETVEL